MEANNENLRQYEKELKQSEGKKSKLKMQLKDRLTNLKITKQKLNEELSSMSGKQISNKCIMEQLQLSLNIRDKDYEKAEQNIIRYK